VRRGLQVAGQELHVCHDEVQHHLHYLSRTSWVIGIIVVCSKRML
jgi:hypothetical protein